MQSVSGTRLSEKNTEIGGNFACIHEADIHRVIIRHHPDNLRYIYYQYLRSQTCRLLYIHEADIHRVIIRHHPDNLRYIYYQYLRSQTCRLLWGAHMKSRPSNQVIIELYMQSVSGTRLSEKKYGDRGKFRMYTWSRHPPCYHSTSSRQSQIYLLSVFKVPDMQAIMHISHVYMKPTYFALWGAHMKSRPGNQVIIELFMQSVSGTRLSEKKRS